MCVREAVNSLSLMPTDFTHPKSTETKNSIETASYLAFVNYYRPYLNNIRQVLAPLYTLLQKGYPQNLGE